MTDAPRQADLFGQPAADDDEPAGASRPLAPMRGLRLRTANRAQLTWGRLDLDAALPEDHSVRAIVAVIERLDLRDLYGQVMARGETAGAPPIDPKILLGLWVYATSEGVGSGRELAQLAVLHAAYRWICGGVEVAYHCLNDFRHEQGAVFDDLVTQVLGRLLRHGLVELSRVAQDGTRVRASAGAASFRRGETLDILMAEARAHLAEVTGQASTEFSARRAAAIKWAAEDRIARLEQALAELPAVAATKQKSGAKDKTPRVSTTDPDARVMKMPDGGFRPAFNVQFATTTDKARVIVGVTVTNGGSDQGEATPMIAQIEERTGVRPSEYLVDGGYTKHAAIDEAAALGVTLYGPVPKPRKDSIDDPHAPKDGDSEAVADWRARMATDLAKAIYKQRAATAETVNADAKTHRGLSATALRGLDKVTGGACLFALTYNILRLISITG